MISALKILAAAAIVLGGGYIGFIISSAFSVRVKQLEQLSIAITQMNFNICFLKMNVSSAIRGVAKSRSGTVSRVLGEIAESIDDDGISPSSAFERAFRRYKNELCITSGDREILMEFAANLGTGDVECEKNNIGAACARLKIAQNEAEIERDRRGKLWRGLGILAGMFVVVILF